MWCNQIFSLINDETVMNVIVCDNYEVANQFARNLYGDKAYAVDTTQYPLGIGYKHIEGKFFTPDGEEVLRNLTADEEANLALNKANDIEAHQTEVELDVDYRLSILELGIAQ